MYAEGITADAAPGTDHLTATAKARLADGPESERAPSDISELIKTLTAEIGGTWTLEPATSQPAILTPASPRFTPARRPHDHGGSLVRPD